MKPVHGAGLVAFFLWGASVCAQTIESLPEVRVSAGLIEQRQFDTPGSVQAIEGERIRASGPQVNLSDVLSTVPGVVALNRNNYAQDVQISIRGFGARAAFGLRGIKLLADGIPATTPDGQGQASTVSLTSVDRIEVLTGPLAQIYGNAAGGVIQTFTREAGDQPEAQTQLYVGAYGLRRSDWQLSARSGQVGVVADYSTFSTDGYRANSAARRQQLNSVITLDGASGTRHKFIVNLFEMPQALDPLGLSSLATPTAAGTNAITAGTRKTVHQEQVGWVMQHPIDRELQLNTRLYRGDRSNLQYLSSSSWVGLQRQYYGAGVNLQGQSDRLVPVRWTVGLEVDQSGEQRQGGPSSAGMATGVITRNEWNQANSTDLFAQANWLLSDAYTLVTGARNANIKLKSTDQCLSSPCTYVADGSGQRQYHATNPVLGLTWHASPSWNLYANTGRGLETPTLAEAAYTNNGGALQGVFNPSLLAATSRHLEVGVKFADGQGSRWSLAWFDIHTQNEIVTDLTVSGQSSYQNATRTQRQGMELSGQQLWGRHLRTDVSLTAMKAVYDQAFGAVLANNRLPAIPDRLGFVALSWSQAGWGGTKPPIGWQGSVEWLGRSRLYANETNTLAAGGYVTTQLRLRYRQPIGESGAIEPFLAIDNLTQKTAVASVIVNQSAPFEPALPRTWTLGLQAKWAL